VSYTRQPPTMTVTLRPAWVDFLLDVYLCIHLFLYTVCLCMTQILLEFFIVSGFQYNSNEICDSV
jgi:hypothetical protein